MNDSPLISIILPTYNRAALLPRAIQSVLNQTCPHWELIIWDDGSQDETAEVIRSVDDKRIRYYYADNHGVAYARNRAMEKATGKYVAFLDSDDTWIKDKLSLQINAFETHSQIAFLFGDFINIHLAHQQETRNFEEHRSRLAMLEVSPGGNDVFLIENGFAESLAGTNYIAADTVMVRRNVVEEVGFFTETLRNSEDFELWWRIALSGICCAYLDRVLLYRYKPENSLSSPGVARSQNEIAALELCTRSAVDNGRKDLVFLLYKRFRNAWQNMITACAKTGDLKDMWRAFGKATGYGFRPGTLRLLLEGVFQYWHARTKGQNR